MESEKYTITGIDDTFINTGNHYEHSTYSISLDEDVIFKHSVKFDNDVVIGTEYTNHKLQINTWTTFTNNVEFKTATGSFVLGPGSYIPSEVLRYTQCIKDIEKILEELRRDYFHAHFYEWINI